MTSQARRGRRLLAFLALSSVVAAPSSAQTEVSPGALIGLRVRIAVLAPRGDSEHMSGVVVGVDGPNLVIDPSHEMPERRVVPMTAIQRLDVHRGRIRATKDGLLVGAIVAGAAGGTLGWLQGVLACDGVADCNHAASQTQGTAAGMALGALVGAGLGAAVGSYFTKDLWQPVHLRRATTRLSPQSVRGGVGIAVPVRF